MSIYRILALSTLAVIAATTAYAEEGILEINYACAVNTGCFPGDTAGLPVTITNPGSYALTGNIHYYGENTNAITIRADDVSIDMRGFSIRCRQSGVIVIGGGQPPLCSATNGTASGILVNDLSLRHGAEVKNGSIIGMPNYGVRVGGQSVVRNIRVRNNGTAIQAYFGSLVENNVVYANDTGINLQFTGGYRDNEMFGNNPHNVIGGVNLGGNMCNATLCP